METGAKEIHIDGEAVCNAFRDEVRERFANADQAIETLRGWNIHRSRDVRRIVFALVRDGQLRASPSDRIEDFEDRFIAEELFD